jgi:hypothetical protein
MIIPNLEILDVDFNACLYEAMESIDEELGLLS